MDIVLFMSNDWDDLWATQQKVAVELSKKHRVLVFETLGFSERRLEGVDFARIQRRFLRMLRGGIPLNPQLTIESAPALPFMRIPQLKPFLERLLISSIKRKMKKRGFSNPVFWTFLPSRMILKIVDKIPHEKLIYECLDDFSKFKGAPQYFSMIERELVEKADVFFASSVKQVEEKRAYQPASYLVHNAADAAHFKKALDSATCIPQEIADLPKPVLTFIGAFDFWVDVDLIGEVARQMPQASVVLIGPADYLEASLPSMPNVHYLGRKPYDSLPGYLKGTDVGLLPFRNNTYMETADPIIMYDMLAAGRPVAATDFHAAREMDRELIRIAKSPEAYVEMIQQILKDDQDPAFKEQRIKKSVDAAERRSWKFRVQKQFEIMGKHHGQ